MDSRERPTVVLVVDDDPAVLRLLTLTLRLAGYEVCVASNGSEALLSMGDCSPDVIVLDMQMPVMDGTTFYKRLREGGWRAPVLVLTALSRSEASATLLAQGYLVKPFLPDELIAQIETLAA